MDIQIESAMPEGFMFEREQNVMHGSVNGIAFLIVPVKTINQFRIQLHADIEKSRRKEEFLAFLHELEQRHPIVRYVGYDERNTVSINAASREQEDKENLTSLVSELSSGCSEYGISNCCSYCKQVLPLRAAAVDGSPALLCENCLAQQMNWEQGGRKENIFLGLTGAFLGAFLGMVLWVVIGMTGYIAGIAGLVMVICAVKGYQLLGKKISRKGIIISILISCLMIAGAEYVSLGIVIFRELGESYYLSLADSFALVPALLEEPDVMGGVKTDLLIGYAFAVLASFSSVRRLWTQVEQEQTSHTVVPF